MRTPVVVAGVGDVGKYIVEELMNDERYQVFVMARKKSPWLEAHHVDVIISDYSEDSVVRTLNDIKATALISCINCAYDTYFALHQTLLNACLGSESCKRFIPGEYAGNLDDYPQLPRYFAASRQALRDLLAQSDGVEWTIFNCGWLMDYFLPPSKTHIHPIDYFPVNVNSWRANILGTGDEPQSWTCARNIGQAIVELLAAAKWEPVTYVVGQWGTFNEAVKILETMHAKAGPMPVEYKPAGAIMPILDQYSADSNCSGPGTDGEVAEVQEWMLAGASACPRELTLAQRDKFFSKLTFLTIEELLRRAPGRDFV